MNHFLPDYSSLTTQTNHLKTDVIQRVRLRVTGVVQGVGFRPFVYGLARKYDLAGFVGNDSSGVFIEIEGPLEALRAFQLELVSHPPLLAHIETLAIDTQPLAYDEVFRIVESIAAPDAHTLISPDLCVCEDCLRELHDPHNRRYRYPFINCTHCGPRFTIIEDIPYDRPKTTMREFVMCETCAAEYYNPLDRRFHAQPTACPDCGPHLSWRMGDIHGSVQIEGDESALQAAREAIRTGKIVAVKGLGGFHLACDATNADAVRLLRQRKQREDKPFAVMVRDIDTARQIAHINAHEAALLTSRERPIVLVYAREDSPLAAEVAPQQNTVGLMLPYTPLHVLLLEDLPPLVMTSGNLSGEPIVTDNAEALEKLSPLVDGFLLHDRAIHVPCDDSVMRVFQGEALPYRRSRGYAPFPVALPFEVPPVLAVGGELKNTFCLAQGQHAFMSQHIGDMETLATLKAFHHAVEHMQALFRVMPEAVVCDAHPAYLSSQAAAQLAASYGVPLINVVHHHAHIAAVMAENMVYGEKVIGFSFDGTGYGDDHCVWGGEVLIADECVYERVAHLKYLPLAGGDAAVKRPYRLALSDLWALGMPWEEDLPPVQAAGDAERGVLRQQLERGFNTVPTSSMGRLFDAVSSLIGLCHTVSYEGQAAMELESVIDPAAYGAYHFEIHDNGTIDPTPVFHALLYDLRRGVSQGAMAARFHRAVARMVCNVALCLRRKTGIHKVALSGGVFQNVALLEDVITGLQREGFTILTHHHVPPNDGGLALGQVAVARGMMRR